VKLDNKVNVSDVRQADQRDTKHGAVARDIFTPPQHGIAGELGKRLIIEDCSGEVGMV
jgi:hypothetical protein